MASDKFSEKDTAIDGLNKLRIGALIQLIAGFIGLFLAIFVSIIVSRVFGSTLGFGIPWLLGRGFLRTILSLVQHISKFVVIALGIFIASAVLTFIAIFGYFIPGASRLADWKPRFSSSVTLMEIGYVGGLPLLIVASVILVLGILMASMGLVVGSLVLYLLSGILTILGFLGLLILLINLYSEFGSLLLLLSCLLLIARLILSFFTRTLLVSSVLSVIAWVLIYVGLEESAKKLEIKTATPSTSLI